MINRLFSNGLLIRGLDLSPQFLLRWTIVLSVILLSTYLGSRVSTNYLIAIIGGIAVLILIRLPPLGLVGVIAGLVIPFSISTGSQTPFNTTLLIIPALLVLWIAEMLRRHQFRVVPSSTNLPMFALTVSATISLIAGNLPWNLFASTAPIPAQVGGWAVFVFSVGVYFLVANLVKDQRWLQTLTWLFLTIAGLYMIGRFGIPPLTSLSAMMTEMRSDGSIYWVWIMALASGQLLFNRKLHPLVRILLILLIALTIYNGFFRARDWASGWLPPLIALGAIILLRSWRLGLLAAVLGFAFLLIFSPNIFDSLLGSTVDVESYSLMTRDVARQILLQQVLPLSPIWGLGPANYYYYTPLYSILGWYVRFNSHNNYVDIVVQTGIIGLLCFFWAVGAIGLLSWRLRKRFAGDFADGYVHACLGGLGATLVSAWLGDWLLPFVYNIGLNGFRASVLAWLFLGGLVVLDRLSNMSTGQVDVRSYSN